MVSPHKERRPMNEKFYALTPEKRERILVAGYRVFAGSPYRKCPVQEIADEAGISKSLLFHYFRNKKELYLFLWDHCVELTLEELRLCVDESSGELFSILWRSMQAKAGLLRTYPDMALFALRAYYEKDPEVCQDIQARAAPYLRLEYVAELTGLPPEKLMPGRHAQRIWQAMCRDWIGFLWQVQLRGRLDLDALLNECAEILQFWETIFRRQEGNESCKPSKPNT